MKVRLENLKPYTRYALQVRGHGGVETPWSPTYLINTERDRIAPPVLPAVYVEGAEYSSSVWHWYGQDISISWDGYTVSDQSTWDHSHYIVKMTSSEAVTRTFQTTDRRFVLSYAMNVASFGGYGCPNFSEISVWGVDKTGNPSYNNVPWSDGPHANSGTTKLFGYTAINPAPTALQGVTTNFESPDLIFSWQQPSGLINQDVSKIKIVLTTNVGSGGTKTFYTSANTSGWTLPLSENRYLFNSGVGSPNFDYSITVIDVFNQESTAVTGTAINYPPTDLVAGPGGEPQFQSIGVSGGISIAAKDVTTVSHKDHWTTEIYEKIKADSSTTDAPDDSLTGYELLITTPGDTYDYIPSTSPFAYRWIRARYVDVFKQTGPITKAYNVAPSSYPVKMISPVTVINTAPSAPTDLAVTEVQSGSAGLEGEVYVTWTPSTLEILTGHVILYKKDIQSAVGTPSWATYKVNADRTYITNVSGGTVLSTGTVKHNYQPGDRVSIVNYDANVLHRTVSSVTDYSVTLSSSISGTLQTNTFDRSLPASAIVRSYVNLKLMPGTKYLFAAQSESIALTSEITPTVSFTTTGNPLVARTPLEIGTYYEPAQIISYSINSGGTATVILGSQPSASGITIGKYVSIINADSNINGRWLVTARNDTPTYSISFISNTTNVSNTNCKGTATGGTFGIGANVNGANDGIYMDDSNLWFADTGQFRAGTNYGTSAWAGIAWEPSENVFKISGDLSARTGRFLGNIYLGSSSTDQLGSAIVSGLSWQIDSSRTTSGNGSSVTIPVITYGKTIPDIVNQKAQIFSSLTTPDFNTNGTPVTITAYTNGATPTITVSMAITFNAQLLNGTVYVGQVTALGGGGLIATDENNDLRFMLSSSPTGLNLIGGWQITKDSIKSIGSVAKAYRAGMSSATNTDNFWAGGDPGDAVFRVGADGTMYLGSSSITGTFNVGDTATATKGIKVISGGSGISKIHAGTGTWGNSNTPFYLSADGQFSISNFFKLSSAGLNLDPSDGGRFKIENDTYSWTESQPYDMTAAIALSLNKSTTAAENYAFSIYKDTSSDMAMITFPSNNTSIIDRPRIYGKNNWMTLETHYAHLNITSNGIEASATGSVSLIGPNDDTEITLNTSGIPYISGTNGLFLDTNGYAINTGDVNLATTDGLGASYLMIKQSGSYYYIYRLSSSRRYKTDIHDADPESLKKVLKLNPKRFRGIPGPMSGDTYDVGYATGVIAEEVHEQGLDWLINYDNMNRPDGVSYPLISLGLVEVAKEQRDQIDALNQTVLQLEERINALEQGE